ncbi:MAG: hypothetical protein KAU38_14205 [Desulfobacterales bacterium]|nr:hypothetical protein [Desulfobacterales bacterium]
MIKKALVLTIGLAFILFTNINWATAQGGMETGQVAESEEAKQKVYRIEETVVTANGAEKRSLPYQGVAIGFEKTKTLHLRASVVNIAW